MVGGQDKAANVAAKVVMLGCIVIGSTPFVLGLLVLLFNLYNSSQYAKVLAKETSPLPAEVVRDMCGKLALSEKDRRCKAGATVYAPDFQNEIRERVRSGSWSAAQVRENLDKYKVRCTELEYNAGKRKSYSTCYYDLRGDGRYPFRVIFSAEGEPVDVITACVIGCGF